MTLRDPRHFGAWAFYIGGKEDSDNPEQEIEEIRVPMEGFFNTRQKLENAVMTELTSLYKQGATGYLESVREEAASYGKTPKEFLSMIIEHQICLRNGGTKNNLCWATGLGDRLHSVTEAVDDLVEKAPEGGKVKKVWAKVVKALTPKAKNPIRLSSCRSCGGGKSLKVSKNNRGRSGRF